MDSRTFQMLVAVAADYFYMALRATEGAHVACGMRASRLCRTPHAECALADGVVREFRATLDAVGKLARHGTSTVFEFGLRAGKSVVEATC